jgi:hypothetical protein
MKAMLGPEIVTRKDKLVSVILPIADYEELLERAEEVADVAWKEYSLYETIENFAFGLLGIVVLLRLGFCVGLAGCFQHVPNTGSTGDCG